MFKFDESHTLEKNSELSFVALYQKTINWNSESFTELLKSSLTLWVLEETRHSWTRFSELKALADSEKFLAIVFQCRAKNENWEFGIFTSKQDHICKSKQFRGIVFGYRAKNRKLELGIFTSKHDSMCHKKIRVIVIIYRAKNDNSELGIHLRTNSDLSENP